MVFLPLSNTGQWEEAVRVYSSTSLEVLHDLAGLALAYCRAGLIPESISGEWLIQCRGGVVFLYVWMPFNIALSPSL